MAASGPGRPDAQRGGAGPPDRRRGLDDDGESAHFLGAQYFLQTTAICTWSPGRASEPGFPISGAWPLPLRLTSVVAPAPYSAAGSPPRRSRLPALRPAGAHRRRPGAAAVRLSCRPWSHLDLFTGQRWQERAPWQMGNRLEVGQSCAQPSPGFLLLMVGFISSPHSPKPESDDLDHWGSPSSRASFKPESRQAVFARRNDLREPERPGLNERALVLHPDHAPRFAPG
jgi:hypothetical protein